MTDAGDSTRAAARRRDRRFLLVVAAIGVAVGLVDALSVAHDRAAAGLPLPLWEPLVWEASSVAVLVALSPALMALARRVMPFEAPWPRVVLSQIAGALAFSLAHVAAMGVIRWAAYAAVGDSYPALKPLRDFPYELRKDLLTYAAILAAYLAWLRLFPTQRSEETTAIEVRDGARRRYVALDDILWVEAAGNYVELHRGASPLLHRASLSEMERRLRDANFVRIHRSRLVRRDAVAEVESKPSGDYVVRLEDGHELAGSRRYRRPLLEP
jgi:DNA-binding LytR/AlgR family response regulator